jgi:hypothetical protein
VLSGFAVFNVQPQKWSIFGRVDRFQDPIPDGKLDYLPLDQKEAFTFTTAGLEYYVVPSVRVSPNVEYVKYGTPATGTKPDKDDLALRLTFYWVW